MRPRTQDARYWSSQSRSLCRRCRAERPTRLTGRPEPPFWGHPLSTASKKQWGNGRNLRARLNATQNNTLYRSHQLSHSCTYLAPVALSDFCSSRNELRRETKTTTAAATVGRSTAPRSTKRKTATWRNDDQPSGRKNGQKTERNVPPPSLSLSLNSRSGCDQFNLTRECDDGRVSLVAAMAPAVVHARPLLLLSQ